MQVITPADNNAADGAVAAQWLTRINKYLEHLPQILLRVFLKNFNIIIIILIIS